MVMGQDGMGEMAQMKMPVPKNSIPMRGAEGAFGSITMGGMFTIVKVRDHVDGYADPPWYEHPAGSVAIKASVQEMRRDGIDT
jgi:hypothetical protein